MQRPETELNSRDEGPRGGLLASPTDSAQKGRRIRGKASERPGRIFKVFSDCGEPSELPCTERGADLRVDCIIRSNENPGDKTTSGTVSETGRAGYEHLSLPPNFSKPLSPTHRRIALDRLPVNVKSNAQGTSSPCRSAGARSPTRCLDRSQHTGQGSLSPRKLLWPTEGPHMSRNLKRRQLCSEVSKQHALPVRNFSRHPGWPPSVTASEASPCHPRGSPSKRTRSYRTRVRPLPIVMTENELPSGKPASHIEESHPHQLHSPNEPDSATRSEEQEEIVPPISLLQDNKPELPQTGYQRFNRSILMDKADQNPAIQPHSRPDVQVLPGTATSRAAASKMRYLEAKKLPPWQVWMYRIAFGSTILSINIALLITYFLTHHHQYLLAILVFMKSKDLLSTFADIVGLTYQSLHNKLYPPEDVGSRWILSLVSAYAETDDQILKTIDSLVNQELGPHLQVICVIVDGKNPELLPHFTTVTNSFRQAYTTWKGGNSEMIVHAGFIGLTPIIYMRKIRNAGKKDSLIMGHDLFNFPRKNMPILTQHFRQLIYTDVLPKLTTGLPFTSFDAVFCTDADSIIHKEALRKLADVLARKAFAIAACGILVAELAIPTVEWTTWHLYQQFQYTFGQYVRRQAEGIWGRVTCLPGCITMIAVRPEMGPAIAQYARPVTSTNLLEHQVQYLGTDRRLTWCLLSQSSHLTSHLVPGALCETVVPENLEHYLSQRRRWASNAYFNDYYYAFGKQQRLITRLFALIDIVRQSLVFYRVINTALFIRSLILHFYIIKLTPTLILTKTPALWFLLLVLIREPVLRKRFHKLLVGMCINQMISPILSVIVFANVLLNMGSQVWGTTGLSSADSRPTSMLYPPQIPAPPPVTPGSSWSPNKLASIVRTAVRGLGSRPNTTSNVTAINTYGSNTQKQVEYAATPITPRSRTAYLVDAVDSALRRRTPKTVRVTEGNE